MADPVTLRKDELEQGLNDLQSQMNERVNAPAPPLTAPVDPNAQTLTTSIQVEPPQEEAQPAAQPEQTGPTPWADVAASPEFQQLSPEKKLITFSRWHDETYNFASKHADWESIKNDFNNGAAKTEKQLSAAAGGLTPDQARVKLANEAVNATPVGGDHRAALKALGPDVVNAYYKNIQDPTKENDWDFGQGAGTDIVKAALATVDQGIIGGVKGAEQYLTSGVDDALAKAKPTDIGYNVIKSTSEKLHGFSDFLKSWQEETPKGVGVEEGTVPTQIGEFAGGLAPYMVALPAAVVSHIGGAYGATLDKTGSQTQAKFSAALAGVTDIAFMALGQVTAGIGEGIKNPIARWATRISAGTGGNISIGQLTKAAEASLQAKPGDRYEAFKKAFTELTPADAGAAAGFAFLSAKHAETARADAAAKKIAADAADAAAKAQAAGAPATAAAVADSGKQAAATVQAQAATAPPAKEVTKVAQEGMKPVKETAEESMQRIQAAKEAGAKPEEIAGAENQITFGTTTDAEGEVVPHVEIPADATLEHLQEAKAEVKKRTKPNSADRNAYNKQLDEAIAKKEQEFAPAQPSVEELIANPENRAAAEKELMDMEPDKRKEFYDLQRQAQAVVEDAKAKGTPKRGTPLDQIDRSALAVSDKLGDMWRQPEETIEGARQKYQQIIEHADYLSSQADRMGELNDQLKSGEITKDQHLARVAKILAEPAPSGDVSGSLHPSKLREIQRATGEGEKRVEGKVIENPEAAKPSKEEMAARVKGSAEHRTMVEKRNPEKSTTVAREGSKLPDLSYDGRGFAGEQFTELDPNAESHGATFEVPTNATVEELKAVREAKRRAFSGEEQLPGFDKGGNPTDEVVEAPQAMPQSPEASAKNKAEHARIRAEREAKLAETAKAQKEAGMTRAERSAANKAAHKAAQAAASAARKALREPVAEATTDQVTQDVIKRGIAPTLAELKEAHPQIDITTAADMRRKMQSELKKAYPPAEVPKGSELTQVPHEYTKEDMSMVTTKGADGVTRTEPYFSNDPDDIARKIDAGLVGKDKANRLYIPDELVDNEKVNPAIFDHALFDKPTEQYYVGEVDTDLGHVSTSHEDAVAQQQRAVSTKDTEASTEQVNSYTQLRRERDQFAKAHAHVYTDKWEATADAVNHEAEAEGIPTDQIHIDKPDPDFEPNGTEIESNPEQSQVTHTLQNVQEAHDLGIIGDEAEMYKTSGAKGHVMAVVDNMIKDPKTQPYMAEILKLIKSSRFDKQLRKMKLEFGTIGNDNQFAGRYEYDTDTIRLNPVGGHDGGLRATFFHELIHGVLDQKLLNHGLHNAVEAKAVASLKLYHDIISRGLFKLAKGHDPSMRELEDFRKAQRDMDHPDYQGHDHYPIYDLREFVNGATNNEGFMNIISRLELNAEPKDRPLFAKIRDLVKNAIKRFFAGKEIPEGSVLDHTLDHIFTLIEEGGETAAGKYDIGAHNRAVLERRAGIKREPKPTPKPTPKPPVGGKLTREQRSQINKAAYKQAQEIVKRTGGDVMAEFVRQRDKILARVADPRMLTAEGRVQLADASKRATQRAEEQLKAKDETGLSPDELDAAISGEELPPEPTPAEKLAARISPNIKGDGWVLPDGRFLRNEERDTQFRIKGVDLPIFGGHEGSAMEYINEHPELGAKFEKFMEDRGIETLHDADGQDIKDFMQQNGFLRVNHDGRNMYFTGNPKLNPAGEKALLDHAVAQERRLIHDQETGTAEGTKELYQPPTMTSEIESPLAPKAKKDEGKVKYKGRTGGRANVEFEGTPNLTKAQFDAVSKQIDEDTGTSDATKAALKDQVAIAAKEGAPVMAERMRLGTKKYGKTLKDTGTEMVIAGADSAKNIPRIIGEQQANRVAQDFGGKQSKKTASMDRAATNAIIDEGRDLKRLQNAREQVANSPNPKSREFVRVYDHAIENFDRLKVLDTHDKVMKEQLERDHAYGIETPELKDYVTRLFESPDASDHDVIPIPNGAGGLRYFTKARSFETMADALAHGMVPKTMDIVELDQHRVEASERIIQQKILNESMKSVLAPDGKPIVATTIPRQTLHHGVQQALPPGYQMVTVPGGAPLVVHNDYAPLFKHIYGDSHSTALSRYAGFMKRNTLVLDTYHVGRIMFKEAAFGKGAERVGYGKGLSILEYRKADLAKALEQGDINRQQFDYAMEHYEDAQALIRQGLNVAAISDNMNSILAHAIPWIKGFNPWVFQKLSRGAMLQTAIANLKRNQSRFGKELSRDEVLLKTAKEMNEVFGNLQLQSAFKDPQIQNTLRSLMLAPQWAESQLKSELRGYAQIARAPIDLLRGKARLGTVAQGQITSVLGIFAAMQVASLLATGKTTFQNKKGDFLNLHIPDFLTDPANKALASIGLNQRFTKARAGFEFNPFEIGAEYAFMAQRYLSQHMAPADVLQRIAFNKLNPVPHGAINFLLNRDFQGKRYQSSLDRTRALAESVVPLPPLLNPLVERDPRQLLGLRASRAPGGFEKTILQSVGAKVANAQTARGEMFALVHPFRDDKNYGDNSPPVYRDLRAALDARDERSIQSEIEMLANQGHTEDQIKAAVGISHGGIKPELFTGKADREKFLLQSLTPEQKEIYKEAQADHKTNANLLRATLIKMKHDRTDLVKQLHENARKKTKKDFEQE